MDIISDLGRSEDFDVFDNPVGDEGGASGAEAEDDELVTVPDFFERLRPLLLRRDGSPRLFVQAARYFFPLIIFCNACFALYLHDEEDKDECVPTKPRAGGVSCR